MKGESMNCKLVLMAIVLAMCLSFNAGCASSLKAVPAADAAEKPRVLITSDGEIDDKCSMVRCLLYANEWDIEGIITSSSQYHYHGHRWPGDDWIDPYLAAYAEVYPNLIKHDPTYPTPEYLRERTHLGNVESEGEMEKITAGSQHIVKVLLDATDDRPIWIQAWGGTNTIARALKTIEQEHPERMPEVAGKIRFYFIWEQDATYQNYILPHWGKYNITTIISDQFEAIAYRWYKIIPEDKHLCYSGPWMVENILENHGALCSLYEAHKEGETYHRDPSKVFRKGDFRSEGDSPAFLHTIPTGLRSMESPDWGGWGGRYVRVRDNTWLDPRPFAGYTYPEGRYYTSSVWGRASLNQGITYKDENFLRFFKPMWRWADVLQKDFAARADWCVKPFKEANHPPVVLLDHPVDRNAKPNETAKLSAKGTHDPDGDELIYRWWQYEEADSYGGSIEMQPGDKQSAFFIVPTDVKKGDTIHVICEVTDKGSPQLTRYRRVVFTVR